MYCRRCHYNLQGLQSGVCPECGLAFDPRQPRTYWDGKLPLMRWFWTWSIFFTFATFAGGVLIIEFAKEMPPRPNLSLRAAMRRPLRILDGIPVPDPKPASARQNRVKPTPKLKVL